MPSEFLVRLTTAGMLASLALARAASAQTSVDALILGSLDVVSHEGAVSESSTAPAANLETEYVTLGERLRVFYTLDGGTFSTEGDWGYLSHLGGARYWVSLSERDQLFVGSDIGARRNGDAWSSADYSMVAAFANLQRALDHGSLRGGVRFDARRFDDRAELDQNEVVAFGSGLISLPSRTTLVGEVSVGWKHFLDGALVPIVPQSLPEPAGAGLGGNGSVAGNGRGPGAAVPAGGASGARRPTAHAGVPAYTSSSDAPARQLTVFGRLAQSVADRLAISFEVSRRNAAGAVAPIVVSTPEVLIDDGVYDDPYASDATVWRAGLKHHGAHGRIIEGGVSHWSKFYENTPALDASGAPLPGVWRDDEIWRAEASWREPLAPSRTGPLSLSFVVVYTFMSSSSTDAYYTYDSHRLRAGLSLSY
jgi:hypothetical protein